MARGMDHVSRDDKIERLRRKALRLRLLFEIQLVVMHEVIVGEFLLRAAGEQRGDIGEVVLQRRYVFEFRQQPCGGAAGSAADFKNAQRLMGLTRLDDTPSTPAAIWLK